MAVRWVGDRGEHLAAVEEHWAMLHWHSCTADDEMWAEAQAMMPRFEVAWRRYLDLEGAEMGGHGDAECNSFD